MRLKTRNANGVVDEGPRAVELDGVIVAEERALRSRTPMVPSLSCETYDKGAQSLTFRGTVMLFVTLAHTPPKGPRRTHRTGRTHMATQFCQKCKQSHPNMGATTMIKETVPKPLKFRTVPKISA